MRNLPALQPLALQVAALPEGRVAAVSTWLRGVGVGADALQNLWGAHWVAPMLASQTKAQNESNAAIRALLEQLVSGKAAAIDERGADRLLLKTEANGQLKHFVKNYFGVARSYSRIVAAGSLAPDATIRIAMELAGSLRLHWGDPSACGQTFAEFGFAEPPAEAFLETIHTALTDRLRKELSTRAKSVQAASLPGQTLLANLPKTDESKFRTAMKARGKAIATEQQKLAELLGRMSALDPALKDAAPQGAGLGSRDAYTAGQRIHDGCFYYTCCYVALTIFRNPVTTRQGEEGEKQREKLSGVLGSMRPLRASLEAPWADSVLTSMHELVGLKWLGRWEGPPEEPVEAPPGQKLKASEAAAASAAADPSATSSFADAPTAAVAAAAAPASPRGWAAPAKDALRRRWVPLRRRRMPLRGRRRARRRRRRRRRRP